MKNRQFSTEESFFTLFESKKENLKDRRFQISKCRAVYTRLGCAKKALLENLMLESARFQLKFIDKFVI